MKSIKSTWFEVIVNYEKRQEDGTEKKVNELYLVDAISCSDAENRAIEELKPYISGEFKVKQVKESSLKEVFFRDDDMDNRWYKVKLAFITINEKTEQEKRTNYTYLVGATSVNSAIKNIDDVMAGTAIDYNSIAIQETKFVDVFAREVSDISKPSHRKANSDDVNR